MLKRDGADGRDQRRGSDRAVSRLPRMWSSAQGTGRSFLVAFRLVGMRSSPGCAQCAERGYEVPPRLIRSGTSRAAAKASFNAQRRETERRQLWKGSSTTWDIESRRNRDVGCIRHHHAPPPREGGDRRGREGPHRAPSCAQAGCDHGWHRNSGSEGSGHCLCSEGARDCADGRGGLRVSRRFCPGDGLTRRY